MKSMHSLNIALLGPFSITYNNVPIPRLTSDKIQALIAYLGLESNQRHARETLAELLWPARPPGVARQNLRQSLTRLQRALNEAGVIQSPFLVTRREVQFQSKLGVDVDAVDLTNILQECNQHQHQELIQCRRCCQKLATAVELYRGDFLTGLAADSESFEEWALLQREWFRREVLKTLDALAEHHIWQTSYEAAYQYAWRQLEIDSFREQAHRQAMVALALDGRQPEAMAQFVSCQRILHDELGVAPDATTQELAELIHTNSLDAQNAPNSDRLHRSVTSASESRILNLPIQHTPFVDRYDELATISERLDNPDCHLLTLLGPGGVGKSRLALQAAREKAEEFADGVAFIPLAPIASVAFLTSAIADGLDLEFPSRAVSEEARLAYLIQSLQNKELLLILDNYEHLLSEQEHATEFIVELVQNAPDVKVLVTSREALHLRAEWILDVEGMSHPPLNLNESEPDSESDIFLEEQNLMDFGALMLFQQSAQRIQSTFAISPKTAVSTATICRLVEGVPLAVELAAACIRTHSCRQIAHQIQASLDFLSTSMRDVPERHRSLRAVFENSWNLLSPHEQQLFRRLSVFQGGFTPEAAAEIAHATPQDLYSLLTKSLIRRATANQFEMHEMLRQYAGEKLADQAVDKRETGMRHCLYYMALVASQEEALGGVDLTSAVAKLKTCIDNIRTAWQWAVGHTNLDAIVQSTHGLLRYYVMTSQSAEGESAFGAAIEAIQAYLKRTSSASNDAEFALTHLFAAQSRMYFKQASYADAIRTAQETLSLVERFSDQDKVGRPAAMVLLYWGMCLANQGKYVEAQVKLRHCLDRARSAHLRKLESDSLRSLGILYDLEEQLEQAMAYYEESLQISEQIGDVRGVSACLGNMGSISQRQGDYRRSQELLEQSLESHRSIGDRSSEGRTLSYLGELMSELEEYDQARRYLQQALDVLHAIRERHHEADALVELGKVALHEGKPDEAILHWQQALATYEEFGEEKRKEQVLKYLANVG
ncbi:tetratricopeptide repeat protein [Chloroflexi bacterium TSY]|nr:tetratricopeptide repeat protein [Chloroflexi bacterium TSY]